MARTVRPKVFIGSSREKIELARAVQENLEQDFETKVWDQQVFEPSDYPLESLLRELSGADFGIFVLAPDDFALIRREEVETPRDNVVFELGLFTGKLGRQCTFVCAPRDLGRLHFPTDLSGLTIAHYDATRGDGSYVAAIAPACNKIRRLIKERSDAVLPQTRGVTRFGFFTDFDPAFVKLIRSATKITLYFIHSRRWRENHDQDIKDFLSQKNSTLTVFLPNLKNAKLFDALKPHFEDGPYIPGFVADAYEYFAELSRRFPAKIVIRLFNLYPTYTVYQFDHTIVIAMYPTTVAKRPVPTFEVSASSSIGQFVIDDLGDLEKSSDKPSIDELVVMAKQQASKTG